MKYACRYCTFVTEEFNNDDDCDSYAMRKHLQNNHSVMHATLSHYKWEEIKKYFNAVGEPVDNLKIDIKADTYRSSGRGVNEDNDRIRITIDAEKYIGSSLLRKIYEIVNNINKEKQQ
jgi:hypothetical protein